MNGMMRPRPTTRAALLLATAFLFITGCRGSGLDDGTDVAERGAAAPSAQATLLAFFAALGEERYADAVPLYGGDYADLEHRNSGYDVSDRAWLWWSACTNNGFVCLAQAEVVREEPAGPDDVLITLRFRTPDGELFVRGPCCGETEETMPSESEFDFRVGRRDDRWVVLDLPVYVP